MGKKTKTKSDTIEKLRLILDDPDSKDININQNHTLNELKERLTKTYDRKIRYNYGTNLKSDGLQPRIIIHKQKLSEEIKEEEEIPEFKTIETLNEFQKSAETSGSYKDEELFEIEKPQGKVSEFQEFKGKIPKKGELTKDEEELVKFELVEETEEKITEWKPLKTKEEKTKKIKSVKPKLTKKKTKKEETEGWEPVEKGKTQLEKTTEAIKNEPFEEHKIKWKTTNFEEIRSIDDNIASLLYKNNIKTLEDLKKATIKDLTKINGIKRKIAKKINKDVENALRNKLSAEKIRHLKIGKLSDKELPQWEPIEEGEITSDNKEKSIEKDKSKQEKTNIYKFGEYNLYKKEILISNEKSRIVHFFSKTKPDDSKSATLPEGYTVKINKKTGVPYIKKKK